MIETQSAGGIVINSKKQVLLVSQDGSSWSFPKGHIEEGEDALEAAKREINEESGVYNLQLINKMGSYKRHKIGDDLKEDKSELKTIHLFLFKTNQEFLQPIDGENPEARWVEKERVSELLTHPKDKDFFVSVLNQI